MSSSCFLLLSYTEQASRTNLAPGPKSGVHFTEVSDEGTKVFAGTFNPAQVYMVDKDGEQILEIKVNDIGTWAEGDKAAAISYGTELAGKVSAALAGQ